MPQHDFRVIQGSPCGKHLAPYIAIVVNDAHATVDSIYRGDDARALLNAHGKHSQYQIYHATPAQRAAWHIQGQPNEPGFSTHEQRSDGVAYPRLPRGVYLPWWCVGFDVLDSDVPHVINAGARYGWRIFQPYHSGSEKHHLNFKTQPKPTFRTAARILRLRATLPKR